MSENKIKNDVVGISADLAEIKIDEGIDECTIYKDFVYVDIQGYRRPKNYLVCKEFCLLDDYGYEYHAIVKPSIPLKRLPSHYRRQAEWVLNNHHKIQYSHGDVDPFELRDRMYPKLQNKIIWVKGEDKIRWLKYMFRNHGEIECFNIDSMDFDISLKPDEPFEVCDYHDYLYYGTKQGPCALSSALLIQDLVNKNLVIPKRN